MVVYFNKKDLVAFGKYLLSKERTDRITQTESEIPVKERLKEVYHADVENFLLLNRKN